MSVYYKLTDDEGNTHGGTHWDVGVTHVAHGEGRNFCSPDVIHLYSNPIIALMLNPIHGDFKNPRLMEVEAEVVANDHDLKLGAKIVRCIRWLPVPAITTEQRVRFAILCGKAVHNDAAWTRWADGWLSGSDRSAVSARAAKAAAAAAEVSAWAGRAARAAGAAEAAKAAAAAAEVSAWAGRAARAAGAAAARAEASAAAIDLVALAHQAAEVV